MIVKTQNTDLHATAEYLSACGHFYTMSHAEMGDGMRKFMYVGDDGYATLYINHSKDTYHVRLHGDFMRHKLKSSDSAEIIKYILSNSIYAQNKHLLN